MARQVSRKNGRVLKQRVAPPPPTCNCQISRKHLCPVPDKCTATNVCYRCEVIRGDNHKCDNYVGQTSRKIKTRIGEHLSDARKYRPEKPVGSRLSHHIGDLFFNNTPHTLNWSILAQKEHFSPVTNFCRLCNEEKVFIIYHPEISTINLRNELYGWCKHKDKYLLINNLCLFIYLFHFPFIYFHLLSLHFLLVILNCNNCKLKFTCCISCQLHLKIVSSQI